MRKTLVTITMATAILVAGSLSSITAQAAPTASRSAIKIDKTFETVAAQHKRRHAVRQSSGDITSFSSSSSVGVNHPPKK